MNTVWLAFIAGLTTGGLSCLAVQGGLLTSTIASRGEGADSSAIKPNKWSVIAMFLVAKLLAYTLLGYMLGLVGSTFTFAPKLMGTIQIVVGLFMIATAARILDIHPIFRYVVIQPPKWVYRLSKVQSRNASLITPAVLGFLTILMPCGVTQATMAVAVSTGNPMLGAAIMFAFVLGTSPVFFALGASIVELLQKKSFSYVAAAVIAVFGILSVNGGMGLRGSFYTLQNIYKAATTDVSQLGSIGNLAPIVDGFQKVDIKVQDNGYKASASELKVGVPVRVTLSTNRTRGCSRAFTMADYGVTKVLPETGEEVVEFTPNKVGRLAYACSMGMYTGSFTVIQ